MDKVEQLYNLYLNSGIITSATSLDMFRAANAQQQSQLYDLGKQKNLFQSTDLPTFQSAWSEATIAPPAAPQPQEEVKKKDESATTELPVAGSLSGSQSQQAPAQPQPNQPQEAPQFFKSQLETITPELIDNTEEFVVPKMNYQFGPMGFKFEESGATGDWMVATAPNGKTQEFSLDPAFGMGAKEEADRLKQWIADNTETSKLSNLESQYTGAYKKFATQQEADDELKVLNASAESFKNEANAFFAEKTALEQEKKYFESIPSGQVKDAATMERMNAYYKRSAELEKKQEELQKKQAELEQNSIALNTAVGKYTTMKAEQGDYFGAGINAWWEGVGAQTAGLINNVIDATFSKYTLGVNEDDINKQSESNTSSGNYEEDAKQNIAIANALRINEERTQINVSARDTRNKADIPMPKEGQSIAAWFYSLSQEDKNAIVDKANDDIKKDLKINILPAAREGARTVLGDDNTTVEYSRLLEEGFWGGALLGTAKSLPALIGGNNTMGWAMRTANMYAQNTDAIYKEMEQNPNFKDISEQEKFNIIAPIGITSAALESLGFRNVIANKGLLNRVALAAIGKAGATTTAKTFGELVKNEAKSMMSKGLLTLAGAGLAEAETGAAQQVSEYAFKELYNAIKGKEMFITPDFMSAEYVKDVAKAGAQEMIGGFVLGTLPAISAAYSKQGYHQMDDNLFKVFEKGANDENFHKAIVLSVKTRVAEGKMTLKEGKEMLNNYRNSVGLFNSLPENLDTNQKKDAMNLLKEKRDLEQQISGKDEALTRKQRNRIDEINNELETMSEVAAAQPRTITLPTGNQIQVEPEKADELNALMSEYNQLNDSKNEAAERFKIGTDGLADESNNVEWFESEQQRDEELQKRWEQSSSGQRQAEIMDNIMTLTAPTITTATATTESTILSTPDTTTQALEDLPSEDKTNITFMQEDGTETPVMGNERMLADLFHQAQATPEAERTPAQQSAVDAVEVSLKTQLEEEVMQMEQQQQQPQQVGVLSTPEATEAALKNKSIWWRTTTKIRGENNEYIPVMGNERMVADLFHQAQATPEAERTPAQKSVIEEVEFLLREQIKREQTEQQQQQPRPERGTTKQAIFNLATKSLKTIFPNIEVEVLDGLDNMIQHAKTKYDVDLAGTPGGAIVYNRQGKPIAILIDGRNNDVTTLPHEIWHAILSKAFGENEALFKQFRSEIDKTLRANGYGNIADHLDEFSESETYKQSDTQAEEWLVQFGGYLTASGIDPRNLKPRGRALLQQLKDVFNKFAMKITGQPIFLEDAKPEDILGFMVSISDRMSRGESIAEFFKGNAPSTQQRGPSAKPQVTTEIFQSFDEEYPTVQSLIDGVNNGELLVHTRVKDGTNFKYGIEPSAGEYLRSTDAWQTAEEYYGEGPELIFFAQDFSWATSPNFKEVKKADNMESVFVRKDKTIQKNLGTGNEDQMLYDGTVVPYERSPLADFESDLYRGVPAGVETGDWYTNKAQDVVGVVDTIELSKSLKGKPTAKLQVTAYHGGPHEFDRFSTEKIGTGEGNQAFGWGLYFTDVRDIAKEYAERLSEPTIYIDGKKFLYEGENKKNPIWDLGAELFRVHSKKDLLEEASIQAFRKDISQKKYQEIVEFAKTFDALEKRKDKSIYDVTLHEGKTPDQYTWLEWDSVVPSETKQKIYDSLTPLAKGEYAKEYLDDLKDYLTSPLDGEKLYRITSRILGGDKQASLFLLENGIDGVKYPADTLTRVATYKTARGFNYVVFDENAVTVKNRAKQSVTPKSGAMLEANPVSFDNAKNFASKSSFANKIEFKKAIQGLLTSYLPELKKQYGKSFDPSKNNELTKKYLSDAITNEAVKAIEEHPEAIGWYDEKTRAALDVISAIHPEIATDKESRGSFILPLAVMSNGNLVDFNFDLAEKQYDYFKKNGRFNPEGGFGLQQSGIKKSILLINSLLDSGLTMSDINTFLTSKFRAGDLKVRIDGKLKDLASGELADELVYGAVILGPKIGNGFYMNLWGQFDQLTMDRWFMRTWGRLTGTLLNIDAKAIAKGKKRVSDALAAIKSDPTALATLKSVIPKLSGMSVADLAKSIEKASMDKDSRAALASNPKTDELRKAGNSLSKNISGEKEAPANGNERKFIREVFTDVARRLKEEHNIDITMADLQAVLWYPEKILYESFKGGQTFEEASEGYTSESAPDYFNAAKKLATKLGVNETEINQALSRGRERAKRNIGEADTAGRESVGKSDKEVLGKITESIAKSKEGKPRVKAQQQTVQMLAEDIESEYGATVDLYEDNNNNITLSGIVIPEGKRGQGIGGDVMRSIIAYADENGKRILLTPSKSFGATSIERLKSFYKGLGFIENKGKNKDFTTRESMYRNPSETPTEVPTEGKSIFRTPEGAVIGFQYDTDKVARERFNISQLEQIGAGSDRVVFDMGDGKVLKVAKTARGLEQNIHEGDGYLTIVPEVFERGLNYVVTENVPRLRASDMVPVYNEEGEQTGEARAAEMIKDLQRFSQSEFNRADPNLQDVLMKYGLQDVMSYDVLWGDFNAMRNWGYQNGQPLHTDGGTFGGVDMLSSRPSKSLNDPEFREIYNKSRQAKKQFNDTDLYTKFQQNTGPAALEEVRKIAQRYNVNSQGFAPKQVNDIAMKKELAPYGYSVKRAKVDEYGRGGGVYIIDGRGRFFNPFKNTAKSMDISRGRFLEEEDNIANIPGYDRLINEIEGIIERGKRRGAAPDRIMQGVMNYVMTSAVYERANDVQREQMVRNIQTEFGKRLKSAPSVGRLLGTIKDITKITMSEKDLLKNQIKSLARGARTATAAWRAASRELTTEIKELVQSGKVSTKQVASILRRFSNVNMFNEESVDKFVEYMTKVFADANYAEKIDRAARMLATARKNIRTKIGISESAAPLLQQLFAINPYLIPDAVLDKYLNLVDMFGQKMTVLELAEVENVINDANEILNAVDEEVSLAEDLAIRFDNYIDKVFDDDGKLDYAATLTQMEEQGEITAQEAELMRKYKKLILPKVEKPEMTEEEIQEEKDRLISVIGSLDVNATRLPTRDERNLASRLSDLLTPDLLNQLTIPQLKNVIKLIDNIDNGYLPHYAQLTVERLNSFKKSDVLVESVESAKPLSFNKLYSSFKSIFTRKDATLEMVRRGPLFFIDQLFGDFKTKNIFNSVFKGVAQAQALFDSEINKVNKKLDQAHEAVAKSFRYSPNKTLMSSFKMMTYMLQLEYESNPNSKEVHPASKVLKATIKHIDNGKSKYGDREANMLEEILKKYGVVVGQDNNGKDIIEIDNNKLYDSFNPAEKKAIKTIQEINESMRDKAVYTAAVIRGDRINPLNNYVHHYVMHEFNPDENATGTQTADEYNNSMRPSTRAQSLIERTRAVSPMNFDVFASAQRGAKFVLLDYTMTEPIRTARKTLNQTLAKLEAKGRIPKEQREVFNAINGAFDEVVKNVLTNNFVTDSFVDKAINFISKTGYRAILASVPRFISELSSNIGFVLVLDSKSFIVGTKYKSIVLSPSGVSVMDNVGSKQTARLYHGDSLSGKMIDRSMLSQSSGVKGATAMNDVSNKANMVYNLTLKKYKNFVETAADALISTPDKLVMRPLWFGTFATEFKKESGQEVDFDKIAANDEAYMNEHKDAIEKAKERADEKTTLAGASDNAFMGMLKGTSKPNQSAFIRGFNNFNNFMTRFAIYEYTTARQGIYAAMGNGTISRRQGAAMLAAVATRMTVYTMLTQVLSNSMLSLFADDDEDDEKSFMQKFAQSLASTMTALVLGRDFGNASKSIINYGVEEMNEKFLTELREGEYDPYKDAISYSIVPKEKKGHKTNLTDFITQMGGSFGPALKTADLIARKAFEAPKKEETAIERGKKETQIRIPLEVLGHLGYIPLYKDIRKVVMDQMYKDLETADKKVKDKKQAEKEMLHGYENKTDMKRYNPELYEQVFGEKSPGYNAEEAKRKIEKEKEDLERRRKDELYNYQPKKTQEKEGFGSQKFGGESKKQSGGFGSKKFGE